MENRSDVTQKAVVPNFFKVETATNCWVTPTGANPPALPNLAVKYDCFVNVNDQFFGFTKTPFTIYAVGNTVPLFTNEVNCGGVIAGGMTQLVNNIPAYHLLVGALDMNSQRYSIIQFDPSNLYNSQGRGEVPTTAGLAGIGGTQDYIWCFENAAGWYLDLTNPESTWEKVDFSLSGNITSVCAVNGVVYFGYDNGSVYALSGSSTSPTLAFQYSSSMGQGESAGIVSLAGVSHQKNYVTAQFSNYLFAACQATAAAGNPSFVVCISLDGPVGSASVVPRTFSMGVKTMAMGPDGFLYGASGPNQTIAALEPVVGTPIFCVAHSDSHTILPNDHCRFSSHSGLILIADADGNNPRTVNITTSAAAADEEWNLNFSIEQGGGITGPSQPGNPLGHPICTDLVLALVNGDGGWTVDAIDIDPNLTKSI